jgi:hypothetical protein
MTVPASREEIVSGLAEVLEEVAGTPADKVVPRPPSTRTSTSTA